jgi:hypothetical protein
MYLFQIYIYFYLSILFTNRIYLSDNDEEIPEISVLKGYKGHRRPGLHILHILQILYICHILHILHILYIVRIFRSDFLQVGWMPASQPSSTSAGNQLKSYMLFQCPPY